MKIIVKYEEDFGRMGDLSGIFVTTQAELDAAIGKEYDFGEALGKHSEICGELTADMVTVLNSDPEFITKFEGVMGTGTICGWNPVESIQERARWE